MGSSRKLPHADNHKKQARAANHRQTDRVLMDPSSIGALLVAVSSTFEPLQHLGWGLISGAAEYEITDHLQCFCQDIVHKTLG